MTRHVLTADAPVIGILLAVLQCGSPPKGAAPPPEAEPSTPPSLAGTSWQLVKFQGGDEAILTPDDRAKYTLSFEPDGSLAARIDCNLGRGTWKSPSPPQIEFGPLALTRAMCPPGSLHDQIVKQWPNLRSYVMRHGHLFLSLMADGGIYEFEPMTSDPSKTGAVRGTATYRERMALPPGAALEVVLEDVSRADAPAEVIGLTRVENPGNPPFRFEIPYDRSRVDSTHRYAMRARIMVDGKPFFGTDRSYPVLTGGSPDTADLMLRRAAATEPLENTYWKLMQLADAPVTVAPGQQEPHLIFNSQTGKVTGSGGCNRLTGAYQASAGRLSLDGMAGTMMACTEGMETERAFLETLGEVSGWRIAGQQLELTDEGGAVVARFEARHME